MYYFYNTAKSNNSIDAVRPREGIDRANVKGGVHTSSLYINSIVDFEDRSKQQTNSSLNECKFEKKG
jgi:hypothetical protein